MSIESKALTSFEKKLISKATKEMPRESLKIVRKMGSKARTLTAKNGRKKVKKVTGRYHKGWKRGKAYRRSSEYNVQIRNIEPHAHLIEDGHRIVDKNGGEHGFKEGQHVLENSLKEFENTLMDNMLDEWLDELLDKGL